MTEDPVYIYNQGRCFEQNGRCDEAILRFREYLRKAKKGSSGRVEAETHIAECKALLAEKSSAEATHQAPVKLPERAVVKAEPAPAATAVSSEKEVPALAPPVSEPVRIPAPAPAGVSAPTPILVPAPGPELVTNPVAPSRDRGRGLRIGGIACGVVGLGSVATGVYFCTRAKSYSDKVSGQDPIDPSDDSAGKRAETFQWVFYGVGGAAIATGVVLYVLGSSPENTSHPVARVTPVVGPGLAGIAATGAF